MVVLNQWTDIVAQKLVTDASVFLEVVVAYSEDVTSVFVGLKSMVLRRLVRDTKAIVVLQVVAADLDSVMLTPVPVASCEVVEVESGTQVKLLDGP